MSPDVWTITNRKSDAHSLGQHNSVFTISNGYLGLKGNLQEDRDGDQPVTLIHGVYDELDMFSLIRASNQERHYLDPRYFDTAGRSPAVANLPNPLLVRTFIADREVSLTRGTVRDFQQRLDMKAGVYSYGYEYRDPEGRITRIEMARFASVTHPHQAIMRYTVTPLNHNAPIRILTGIDAGVRSNTTGERQFQVTNLNADPTGRCILRARTPARGHDVHVAVANVRQGGTHPTAAAGVMEHDAVYTRYEFAPAAGDPITIHRFIVLACSDDMRHGVPADVETELDEAARQGFEDAWDEHRAAWRRLWQLADVQIDGDDDAQRYLRFCLYHLLAAAPRHTDKLSVPVKLLSGEEYQGTTFYDTDLYIVPFYLFTLPDIARTCLNWRHLGLEPGRRIARDLGYQGAKLAWQAGPRGEECLGRWWRFTRTNVHVNGDVAYALVHYYRATGDEALLRDRGIDLLVETARFFTSRVKYAPDRNAYDMHDVAGPDEGHCRSTNNFYTNYLAAKNLRWARSMLDHLRSRDPDAYAACVRRLTIGEDEPQRWTHIADRLTLLFDPRTKVFEQCEGFYRLKPVPPDLLGNRKVWFATVSPYQGLNQPDVVMALVLFRDEFDHDVRRANWNFYKDKSLNLSSMSFAVNAIMAADMGDMDDAYRNFLITAGMDLDEGLTGRKDTRAGLHGTAAGGAWLAAVFGFGGVCLSEKGLRINPNLPPRWKALRFSLAYRGRRLTVAMDQQQITVTHHALPVIANGQPPAEVALTVAGRKVTLAGGQSCRVRYRNRPPKPLCSR